jgi:hypothetical protein
MADHRSLGEGGQPDKTGATVRLKADTTHFSVTGQDARDGPPQGGRYRNFSTGQCWPGGLMQA